MKNGNLIDKNKGERPTSSITEPFNWKMNKEMEVKVQLGRRESLKVLNSLVCIFFSRSGKLQCQLNTHLSKE